MDKLTQIAIIVQAMCESDEFVDDAVLARAIGTVIFDIPTTRSGMVSSSLLDEYGYRPSIAQCTLEHYHSRNESGYHIIGMMRDGKTFKELVAYLREASMVHLTTQQENIELSKIQNHPLTKDLTWQEQYDLAGIELVEDPGCMPRAMKNKLKKMSEE